MNTFEPKDPAPEITSGAPAPPTSPPALPAAPQPAAAEITPPQLPPPTGGLAAAAFGGVIEEIDVLSEHEVQRLGVCEGAIQAAWNGLAAVGLALAEIRDGRLYRNDFTNFEHYCQSRWEFKRGKANYLIAAARICRQISESSGLRQPDRESQLRPLFAVSLENAELAWQYAVQFSSGRLVTARVVKRAVQDLHLPLINVRPAPPQTRQSKRELRGIVSQTMDEMLDLITRKADHCAMLQKFEALHGQLQLLFQHRKPKRS